jgi:hypothetical protein
MKIYLIGNELVPEDSLAVKLKPFLEKQYPQVEFLETDPNENFIPEENSVIIDTVIGINEVTEFRSLDSFSKFKTITPHDYDLLLHLNLLMKLKKISNIIIIGIPKNIYRDQALNELSKFLKGKKA